MFVLYQIVVSIFILISPIIILFRILNNKENKTRFIEKFSFPTKNKIKGKLIWFHGASVGELLSVIPLIKYYEKNKLVKQILVTSSTLSSSNVIKKFKLKKTIHQFYPIDYFPFTNKFLNYWNPSVGIFIDSEIWPCMFRGINKKYIPLILLNARITKKTFYRWIKLKKFSKLIFNYINSTYPQNLETKKYLKKLNHKNIKYLGNLKFAEDYEKNFHELNKNLKTEFKKKKIWIASSTHKSEEVFCAKAHIELKKKFKNLLTIIIPRHTHRVDEIYSDLKELGLKTILHSSNIKKINNADIYLVDTFGETKKFHKIGNTVFLGGSIIKRGGQSPLEAARFGAKILHGPNTDNFKDVYKLLKSMNISKKINSPKELASSVKFKKNQNSGAKIRNIGDKILKKTIKELDKYIFDEVKKT